MTKLLFTAAAALAACGALASGASADTASGATVSDNWAGYVAGGPNGGGSQQFSNVSASWVQPTASCSSGGGETHSAFWVGIGGAGGGNGALEQAGTEADCTAGGSPTYYAWYELLPAAPVQLGLSVNPGDHVSTSVGVNGSQVTVTVSDSTTGQSTTKNLQTDNIDTSSAEWIAEAPSECDGSGNCQPLPLTDFGTVTFSNASATSTDGHTGTISDSDWTAQPTEMGSPDQAVYLGGMVDPGATGGTATPSTLDAAGDSFTVSSDAQSSGGDGQTSSQPSTGASGDPYGYSGGGGDPYGYSSSGGGGDPYGYSGGGGSYSGGGDPYGYSGGGGGYPDPGYGGGSGYGYQSGGGVYVYPGSGGGGYPDMFGN
jgi:hypothetical protein